MPAGNCAGPCFVVNDNGYCSSGADDLCCCPSGDSYYHVMVYVFEDINGNGKWDGGEQGIDLGRSDPRVAGARLKWVCASGCNSSSDDGDISESEYIDGSFMGSEDENTNECRYDEYSSCNDERGVGSACRICGGGPFCVPATIESSSFGNSFNACALVRYDWCGSAGCENAVFFGGGQAKQNLNTGVDPPVPYDYVGQYWSMVNSTGRHIYSLDMSANPNGYEVTTAAIDQTFVDPIGYKVLRHLLAFGVRKVPTPPEFVILNIRNVNDVLVSALDVYGNPVAGDAGGRNHVCQTEFSSTSQPRVVDFRVNLSDVDGGGTIRNVNLALLYGSNTYLILTANNLDTTPVYSISGSNASWYGSASRLVNGNNLMIRFPVQFSSDFNPNLYDLRVSATDATGLSFNNIDAGRDFKVWNCRVPIYGSMYDTSSVASAVCPNFGSVLTNSDVNFTDLNYVYGTIQKLMSVTSPAYSSDYPIYDNSLEWGVSYIPFFNNDLNLTNPVMRLNNGWNRTTQTGTTVCPGGSITISDSNMDAYQSILVANVDFGAVANQDPWWQGRGVSILGRTSVRSDVPVTCTGSCVAALNIDNTDRDDNGVVMSSSLSSTAGAWGSNNNWYKNGYSQIIKTLDYTTMFNSLNGKVGVRTAVDWTTNPTGVRGGGGTGVVFVDGPLTIDANHSVVVGNFLMVVVRGNIIVNPNVTTLEGAYVATGNISITGTNISALNINGMIYAGGNISIDRTLGTGSENNLNPAVRVNIRPDLIFNAPSYMFERLSYIR